MKKNTKKVSILEMANPFYIITLFYIISLCYLCFNINEYFRNWQRAFIYISMPYYIYFIVYLYMREKYRSNISQNSFLNKNMNLRKIAIINNFIAIICIGLIFNCIIYIIKMYGVQGVIKGITDLQFIQDIQRLEFKEKSFAIMSSNVSPIICIILIKQIKDKITKNIIISKMILTVYLILIFIFSNIIGARILILYPIAGCLFIYFSDLKLNIRNIIKIFVLIGVLVTGLFIAQANKTVGDYDRFSKAKEDIINYYEESLHNGLYIIENDYKRLNLAYWTVKPLFNIPIISNSLKVRLIYEKYISEIPIKDRQDDFNYVANLGINPRYNTLSIYGYSYLDFGFYGLIIILLQYLILQYIYYLLFKSKNYIAIIFPIIYTSYLDSLRSYGILNDTVSFSLILLGFYIICTKIKIKK